MTRHLPVLIFLLIAASVFGTWVFSGRFGADRPLREPIYLLLRDLDSALRDLDEASAAGSPERKAEALARAQGALGSALHAVDRATRLLFPDFPPPPQYLNIPTSSNRLLHFSRELTPEMTSAELRLRREMVTALRSGILKGIEGNWEGSDWSVDRDRLISEWQTALKPYEEQNRNMGLFAYREEPIPATVTANRLPDGRLEVKVDWERSYRVFPRPQRHFLVVYGRVTDVQSTAAAKQDALAGEDEYDAFVVEENPSSLFEYFRIPGAREMQAETVTVIGLLEGLPQTLTMQAPEARILFVQHRAGRHIRTIQVK